MDDIAITSYDPEWPLQFEEEAALLWNVLPAPLCLRIEHFGSTAVPGLDAKPILDLLVGVESAEEAKRDAVPIMSHLGYAYWDDNPNMDRLFFVRGLPPNGPRTHHVHMIEADSPLWERLLFRDHLRADPDEAARYVALKRDLAARFAEDREAYTDGKTAYINGVMEKARAATALSASRP